MLLHLVRGALACAIAVIASTPSARAETIAVSPGADALETALAAALANADAHDLILVTAGDYDDSLYITLTGTQQSLEIRRAGGGTARIRAQQSSGVYTPPITVADSAGVTLKDLTLDSGDATDSVPELLVSGACRDVVVKGVKGTAGDDMGAMVTGSTAVGVSFQDCSFSGLLGVGFWLDGVSGEVVNCSASACGLNGVVLLPTSRGWSIDKLTVQAAGGSNPSHPGQLTVRGTGHRVARSTVGGAGEDGIYVTGAGHQFSDVKALVNGSAGFNLVSAQATLSECKASGNLFGLSGGGDAALVLGGKFSDNSSHGMVVFGSGTQVLDATAQGNGGHGIHLVAGVVAVQVRGARVKDNGGEGVVVAGDGCWLEDNVAKGGDGLVDAGTGNGGRSNKVLGGGANDFE